MLNFLCSKNILSFLSGILLLWGRKLILKIILESIFSAIRFHLSLLLNIALREPKFTSYLVGIAYLKIMFLMGEVPIFSTVIRLLLGFVFILSNDCLKVIQFLNVVILLNFSYGKNFIVLFIAFSCKFAKLIFKLNFIFNKWKYC